MTKKKVEFAPQDHVQLYKETARRFFSEVLDMNADECLITDESYLSDFSSCGMPDGIAAETANLKDLYAAWDIWMLGELTTRYGLDYGTTEVSLVTLYRDLEATWERRQY